MPDFRNACFLILALATAIPAAHAEAVPEVALDKDFSNCMGGSSPASDPERAQYCNCVRDGLRHWDMNTYGEVATEQSKATNSQQVPAQIAELARACIAKVLK